MASTYSRLYIQIVFAVKARAQLLKKPWREDVFKYMTGIIKANNQKSIIVNGVEDHVHIFVGLKPTMRISDLVRDIKNNSSNFINKNKFTNHKFCWQEGYGAFSYAHSQIENVYNYIANQEQHHNQVTFKDEYLDFLKTFDIDYDEKFLFDWL